ncbi:MAG: glycosyl hydrolase family 28 protein [Bacteroides sp.]|nr:glycosyl hydrolase family 28 protein [Roseburia sp.]MCM1347120.1 glycosyl hydrolase family 28 protein [Bacteroides sp.]MCM1421591.1 glycosyl hydrolase family 28 protein [Bacteroides sp.]
MKNRFGIFLVAIVGIVAMCASVQNSFAQSRVDVYPAPKEAELNTDFGVRVRVDGGEWKNVDTYKVYVDKVVEGKHITESSSMAYFDFDGEVEVEVTNNHGKIDSARVRPLSYGIPFDMNGNALVFRLKEAANLSVEVNGDIFHNLQLFANPLDANKPKKAKSDKNLIYIAPGVHDLGNEPLIVPSGKTLYVAGGAVIKGCVRVENAHDVKILGRGMIYPHRQLGITISNSKNVVVEGVMSTQCATGGSDSVSIENVKVISYYGWGDGLNVFASNNVSFNRVFARNSDDCTTVYATRKGFSGGCRNIRMTNSTLWADVAHPIFIGIHGDAAKCDVIEDIVYENIDILDQAENQIDYQGCMAINAGDNNYIRNIRFENIRVEEMRKGTLFNVRIFYNKKYCAAPGMCIENVLFKNVSYNGKNAAYSIISGYNSDRPVRGITFENLMINGEHIHDKMPGKPGYYKTSDMCNMFIGEHVENVVFK